MAIYLIRHGETEANRARVLQTPDVPLSEVGLAQAGRLARRLADAGIAGIVSSDLVRAAMTAEALADTTCAPVAFDPGLHERSFGDLRGRAYADLDLDPFAPGYEPPGGESWEVFYTRVAETWERVEALASSTPGHLAVVTHGLVCRAVVGHHCAHEAPPEALLRWGNTSLTILEGPSPRRVALLNCLAHLEEVTEGGPA